MHVNFTLKIQELIKTLWLIELLPLESKTQGSSADHVCTQPTDYQNKTLKTLAFHNTTKLYAL